MSISWYAYVAIGCKIDPDSLYVKRIVKTYNHQFGPEVKFHPQTGEKLWEENKFPIEGYDDKRERIGKFHVVWGTNAKTAVISIIPPVRSDDDEDKFMPMPLSPVIDALAAELKATLEAMKIDGWETYGIHSILYCSY